MQDLQKNSQLVSDRKIDLIYPKHIKALKNAKLLPTPGFPEIPMMKQLWSKDGRDKKEEEKVEGKRSYKNKSINRRNVHLVLVSTLPEKNIYVTTKIFT